MKKKKTQKRRKQIITTKSNSPKRNLAFYVLQTHVNTRNAPNYS